MRVDHHIGRKRTAIQEEDLMDCLTGHEGKVKCQDVCKRGILRTCCSGSHASSVTVYRIIDMYTTEVPAAASVRLYTSVIGRLPQSWYVNDE